MKCFTAPRTGFLRCNTKRWVGVVETWCIWVSAWGYWPEEGSYEHGNEFSGSIKYCAILEWLSGRGLTKKDSSPWDVTVTVTLLGIIHRPVLYSKHNVSDPGFCPRFQVEATQLSLIDRASVTLWTGPEDGDGIHSPKHRVLNKKQADG
jgi:hypothetical protein